MAEPNVTPVAPFDPFAEFERMTNAESGGGGTVALCHISYGYKSYAAGQPQGDTFFPFVPSLNDSNGQAAVAKASAEAFNTLHQCEKPVRLGVQIKAMRDGAITKGQPATWSVDARYFNTDGWTSGCKEVVMPSLKANGILTFPWTGWARLGFKPDPYAEKKQAELSARFGKPILELVAAGTVTAKEAGMEDNGSGGWRTKLVAYVVETFADEATAKASAASDAPVVTVNPAEISANGWKPESEGWDAENLRTVGKESIEQYLAEGKSLTEAAAAHVLTIADALIALGEHRTKLPPVAVAGKYKVDVAEVSKVRDQASVIPF